jgi:hypothetical protein
MHVNSGKTEVLNKWIFFTSVRPFVLDWYFLVVHLVIRGVLCVQSSSGHKGHEENTTGTMFISTKPGWDLSPGFLFALFG